MDIRLGQTEYLILLATRGGFLVWERAIKRDLVTLRTDDASNWSMRSGAYYTSQIEAPLATLNDFIRLGYVTAEGPEDAPSVIYRLTPKGIEIGREAQGNWAARG